MRDPAGGPVTRAGTMFVQDTAETARTPGQSLFSQKREHFRERSALMSVAERDARSLNGWFMQFEGLQTVCDAAPTRLSERHAGDRVSQPVRAVDLHHGMRHARAAGPRRHMFVTERTR